MLAEGWTSHDGLLYFRSGTANNEKIVGWNNEMNRYRHSNKQVFVEMIGI